MATDIKALGDQIVGLTLLEAKALADYLSCCRWRRRNGRRCCCSC